MSFFMELSQFIRTRQFEESVYAVIGSYMDESFDMKPRGVFVVGGLLGRGVAIFELERRWNTLLKRPDIGIEYFKASHCEHGKGQFSKFICDPENLTETEKQKLSSISHEFLDAIARWPFMAHSNLIAAGVGVIQEEFYEVIKDEYAKSILGDNPYRLAYDFSMIQCAWAMKELGTGDSVSFVCDECERYSPLASEAYRHLKVTNPNAAEYMATYSSADEKKCIPLQAADAVVFEIRRALNLALAGC